MTRNSGQVCKGLNASGQATILIIPLMFALLVFISPALSAEDDMPDLHPAVEQKADAKAEGGAKIAARVNGVEIPMDSVIAMMYRINLRKLRSGEAADPMEDVRKEAIDRLVFQEIAYQAARAEGVKADDKDIDSELSNFKKRMGGEEKYKEFLAKSGMTEETLRASAEKKLVLEAFADQKVRSGLVVSEEDAKKEYEKTKEAYETPEKILITNVVFFLDLNDEASMRKAEAVLAAIKADKSTNPWNIGPEDFFVVRDLEVKQDEEPELYAVSKNMKKGELSGVLKTSDSLQIIKILEYQPFVRVPFEKVKASIENRLREELLQERMKKWEGELRKDAVVEIIEAPMPN